jgi:hypothetical protein
MTYPLSSPDFYTELQARAERLAAQEMHVKVLSASLLVRDAERWCAYLAWTEAHKNDIQAYEQYLTEEHASLNANADAEADRQMYAELRQGL